MRNLVNSFLVILCGHIIIMYLTKKQLPKFHAAFKWDFIIKEPGILEGLIAGSLWSIGNIAGYE